MIWSFALMMRYLNENGLGRFLVSHSLRFLVLITTITIHLIPFLSHSILSCCEFFFILFYFSLCFDSFCLCISFYIGVFFSTNVFFNAFDYKLMPFQSNHLPAKSNLTHLGIGNRHKNGLWFILWLKDEIDAITD